MSDTIQHPAKFSEPILELLREIAVELPGPILDPFAGTGRIHDIGRDDTVGIEIEPEWANMHERTYLGDATKLPYPDNSFGSVVTSPTYGNRMADQYDGRDGSRRHTYRTALDRPVSVGSSAGMQWGKEYRDLHRRAWREAFRVIRPGGKLVLNISDHIRKGQIVAVTAWHVDTLLDIGFECDKWETVSTARNRHGANGDARVDFESVILFTSPLFPKPVPS